MVGATMIVIFAGSVAFYGPGSSTSWEAYLLESASHNRMLRVPVANVINGSCKPPCELGASFCACALVNGEIQLPTIGSPAKVGKKGGLPSNADVKSIDWLIHMSDLHPGFKVTGNGKKNTVQVKFKWKSAETCAFDEIPCFVLEDKRRIYEIDVKIGNASKARQAVPELVAFQADIPSSKVDFKVPVNGGTVNLELDCTNGCPVWIFSMPIFGQGGEGQYFCWLDMLFCNDKTGNHMGEYWKLAELSPPSVQVERDCFGAVHVPAVERCSDLDAMQPLLPRTPLSLRWWDDYDWWTLGDRIICPPVLIE